MKMNKLGFVKIYKTSDTIGIAASLLDLYNLCLINKHNYALFISHKGYYRGHMMG